VHPGPRIIHLAIRNRSRRRKIVRRLFVVLMALGIVMAGAGMAVSATTVTAGFTASATVIGTCSVTADNLTFPDYSALTATPTDTNGNLNVTCTTGQAYLTYVTPGGPRQMASGANRLDFDVCSARDATTCTSYPSTGGTGISATGNGAQQQTTLYGRIRENQSVPVGAYSASLTANVDY
jgi:spore coat protein U-like protein